MTKYKYPKKIREDTFLIWKNLGETPLQALERLREQENIEQYIKMTYAGRLDPLAEGEILILIGDECKNKEKYLELDKEYEVEILLGAKTDTGDIMGVIVDSLESAVDSILEDKIDSILNKFIDRVSWEYPVFSSKTVRASNGEGRAKPLFLWALENKLDEINIPIRESEIYKIKLLLGGDDSYFTQLSISKLREQIHSKINSLPKVAENITNGEDTKKLGADFRRAEVLKSWANLFEKWSEGLSDHKFQIIKIRCKCSSGTYMRTLAQKVGEELGVPALALSIVRTEIMLE